eukprot:SAG11_NODE_15526_length_575_cov_0.894958_1_plen_106_part_01
MKGGHRVRSSDYACATRRTELFAIALYLDLAVDKAVEFSTMLTLLHDDSIFGVGHVLYNLANVCQHSTIKICKEGERPQQPSICVQCQREACLRVTIRQGYPPSPS